MNVVHNEGPRAVQYGIIREKRHIPDGFYPCLERFGNDVPGQRNIMLILMLIRSLNRGSKTGDPCAQLVLQFGLLCHALFKMHHFLPHELLLMDDLLSKLFEVIHFLKDFWKDINWPSFACIVSIAAGLL